MPLLWLTAITSAASKVLRTIVIAPFVLVADPLPAVVNALVTIALECPPMYPDPPPPP